MANWWLKIIRHCLCVCVQMANENDETIIALNLSTGSSRTVITRWANFIRSSSCNSTLFGPVLSLSHLQLFCIFTLHCSIHTDVAKFPLGEHFLKFAVIIDANCASRCNTKRILRRCQRRSITESPALSSNWKHFRNLSLLSLFTKLWFIEFNSNKVHKLALRIHAIEEMVLTDRERKREKNEHETKSIA